MMKLVLTGNKPAIELLRNIAEGRGNKICLTSNWIYGDIFIGDKVHEELTVHYTEKELAPLKEYLDLEDIEYNLDKEIAEGCVSVERSYLIIGQ